MRLLALWMGPTLLVACAQGSSLDSPGGASSIGGGGGGGQGGASTTRASTSAGPATTSTSTSSASATTSGSTSSGPSPQSCPTDQFATGIDTMGHLTCAGIDAQASATLTAGCAAYLGWRDQCNACGLVPSKWGRSGTSTCANGIGTDDTCTTPVLSGTTYDLFGLNTDGAVDDNDTFSFGFACSPDAMGNPGPCAPGQFVTATDGTTTTCASLGALDYVRTSCSLYAGWRDTCDGCTLDPFKWGKVSSTACANGAGADDTCTTQVLGADTVQLFGLNTDGTVNDDDKFYVGMSCTSPTPEMTTAQGNCPPGELVTGIDGLGGVTCESPAPLIATYVRAHCELVLGWQDGCNGCTTAPTKWGHVRDGFCANGAGLNDTCTVANLGGAQVSLFGLNTDGTVNDDDKFYIDFACH